MSGRNSAFGIRLSKRRMTMCHCASSVKYHISLLLIGIFFLQSCNFRNDRADAEMAAARVHSQIRATDYSSIYTASAPRFKSIGDESQFISIMQRLHQENGTLQKADEIAYETGIDSSAGRIYLLKFNLEFEQGRAEETMTFIHSDDGQMQLWKLDILPIN